MGSKFGLFGRVSLVHQMLMIQLIEAHQVSHSEFSDLAVNLLILSAVP